MRVPIKECPLPLSLSNAAIREMIALYRATGAQRTHRTWSHTLFQGNCKDIHYVAGLPVGSNDIHYLSGFVSHVGRGKMATEQPCYTLISTPSDTSEIPNEVELRKQLSKC